MKRLTMCCVAMAAMLLGLADVAPAAPANARQAEQDRMIAAVAQKNTSVCPMRVANELAQGNCHAVYSLAPHEKLMILAAPYAGSPLVSPGVMFNGNPIVSALSGNIDVQASIAYADVFFIMPESLVITVVLTNTTNKVQAGTASVRVLMTVPKTTTAAVGAATVE